LRQTNFGFSAATGIRPFLKLQEKIANYARNWQPFNFRAFQRRAKLKMHPRNKIPTVVLFNDNVPPKNHAASHQDNGLR
jgi:hypothetical protein